MSEENRKHEWEISEAELAGVSGAGGDIAFELHAQTVCTACSHDKNRCSGHGYYSLKEYLKENGIDSVNKVNYKSKCPYLIP